MFEAFVHFTIETELRGRESGPATQNRFSLTVCNPKSIQFDSLQPKIDLV